MSRLDSRLPSRRASSLALVAVIALLAGPGPARAAAGILDVRNERAEPVLLQVDRAGMGQVAAHGHAGVPVRAGLHEVVLRSRAGEVLHRSVEQVLPGTSTVVRLAALQAPLRVENPLDRPVRLRVDGVDRGTLAPYASLSLALPPGRHALDLVLGGRTIVSEVLVLGEQRRVVTWAPQPAWVGDLVVDNPLPIPVTLTCSRGLVRTVPAFGRTTYAGVPDGVFALTVRRADGGEYVGELRSAVRAFEAVVDRVPAPRTGILAIESDRSRTRFQVLVDGRPQGVVLPGQVLRLSLPLGSHEVVLRSDDGREVERHYLRVDRYEVARIELESRGGHRRPDAYSEGYGRDHDHDHDHDRDRDHDGREEREEVASATCAMP